MSDFVSKESFVGGPAEPPTPAPEIPAEQPPLEPAEESPWIAEGHRISDDVAQRTESYEPASHTVVEVQQWVTNNPSERDAVLAAEKARGVNARVTLLSWLEGFSG